MSSEVSVSEHNDQRLVICCHPSTHSWTIFGGIIMAGVAAALYATDCCLMRPVYLAFAFAAAVYYLEDWQMVMFDKPSATLCLTVQNFLQKFFFADTYNRSESVRLDNISSVQVVKKPDRSVITVALVNSSVVNICCLSSEVTDSTIQRLVGYINNFLHLDLKNAQSDEQAPLLDIPLSDAPTVGNVSASPVADDTSSATSSEEGFERVSAADLVDLDTDSVDNVDQSAAAAGGDGGRDEPSHARS